MSKTKVKCVSRTRQRKKLTKSEKPVNLERFIRHYITNLQLEIRAIIVINISKIKEMSEVFKKELNLSFTLML